jgi:hypothetical protein
MSPVPVVAGVQDLEEIGRGGFGVVYRGWQPELGREVAVKVISTPGAPGSAVERWRREITAMGRLSNHPNIVAVYSGGVTDDGSPYLVMPYVPGGSLRDRLTDVGPLTPKEVASFGARLAAALATAHEAGVLHRDVKPDNVLLSPYGEPQLTDFGIARLLDSTVTATSSVHATIPYAPPEVLAGQPATESADVYGLGATLFACLTGTAPFPSSSEESLVALVGRIAGQPPPDLRAEGVPDALASVIERALAKTPEERIGSADELRRRLEQVAAILDDPSAAGSTQPVAAVPPTAEADDHTSVMPVVPEAATWAHQAAADPATAGAGPPADRRPAAAAGSRKPVAIGAAVILALLGLAAVAFALNDGDEDPVAGGPETTAPVPETTEEPTTTTTTEPEPTTTTTTTAPTTTTTTTEPEEDDDPPPPAGDPAGVGVAYFDAIARQDLAASYSMLTPEFRSIQSRESYDGYWGGRDVEIVGSPVVEQGGRRVTVPIRDNGVVRDGRLTLVERDGRWMVDGPRPG